MTTLRFLQFSDLHLECSLAGSKLRLPEGKRARIRRDLVSALRRIVEIARAEKVQAVLCPGDVWDDEAVSFETAATFFDAMRELDPIPVFIAPGNHDPYTAFSYYNAACYERRAGSPHPRNLVIFNTPKFCARSVPSLPGIDFYGCCFEENKPRTDRVLSQVRLEDPNALNVLLLHGSQEGGYMDHEREVTAPFTRIELGEAGFDYTALGHYHRYSDIRDSAGNIRAAYAGCPIARGLDETGGHCVVVGEIGSGGVPPDSLKKFVVDPRHIRALELKIDASVATTERAKQLVADALREAKTAPQDIVHVTLRGRIHRELAQFDFDPDWCDAQCFHLCIDQSQLEPEYDIESLLSDETATRRVEGRFAQQMTEMITAAAGDPGRQQILRAALHYGLDALNGREVQPRHVS